MKIIKESRVDDTDLQVNEDYWKVRYQVQKAYDILSDIVPEYAYSISQEKDDTDKSSLMDIGKQYGDCKKLISKALDILKDIKGM